MARWIVLAAFAGCSGKESVESASHSEADSDTDTDSDSDTDTDTDTDALVPALVVHVRDTAGAPLVDAEIRLFDETAQRTAHTDATGAVRFEGIQQLAQSLRSIPASGSRQATAFVPLVLQDGVEREVTLTIPELDPAVPLSEDPVEVALGAGLLATLSLSSLEPADLFSPDPTEVAGIRLDPADWPPIDLPVTVIDVWYTDPFGAPAIDGLPVRIATALPDGGTARLYVGSFLDYSWNDLGVLTAAGGFFDGPDLPALSTVVLIESGS